MSYFWLFSKETFHFGPWVGVWTFLGGVMSSWSTPTQSNSTQLYWEQSDKAIGVYPIETFLYLNWLINVSLTLKIKIKVHNPGLPSPFYTPTLNIIHSRPDRNYVRGNFLMKIDPTQFKSLACITSRTYAPMNNWKANRQTHTQYQPRIF